MTRKELTALLPGIPEPAILALLDLYNRQHEVNEAAKRAAEKGIICLWPPAGRGE